MKNSKEISAALGYSIDFAREKLAGKQIAVLTGAGISTDSGIPDYRGEGRVARHPMTFDTFMQSEQAQRRYWARSFVGWSRIAQAAPNAGHFALAEFEASGLLSGIITQNVDGLHQVAGSKAVLDLHGRLNRVRCMSCSLVVSREEMDLWLSELNPGLQKDNSVEFSPDGDAEIEATAQFRFPRCPACAGVLKPDVVFFGESVAPQLVEKAFTLVDRASALLVAGSSLSVNSGFRFAKHAHKQGKPLVIVNLGPTKADELASVKLVGNTSLVLQRLLND